MKMERKGVGLGVNATSRLRVLSGEGRACILEALPHVIITVRADGTIGDANAAAESFFEISKPILIGAALDKILPFGSSLLTLIAEVRERGAPINEYKVDIGRFAADERRVDAHCAPLPGDQGEVLVVLQERTIAEKIDRQLTHRGAARSVSALAAMLAHEIKNPLSGIRGAAQLLESGLGDEDRALTRLICDETDRIVRLVDRMEAFSDQRPLKREKINIHAVLDHVKQLGRSGFARHVRFVESYDPSLPALAGDRDQLVQVFLNLVKNAAEAIGDAPNGEIELSTAFRPGVSLRMRGQDRAVGLPLEFRVRDNGPGVPEEILSNIFDPFVTTKTSGTGLGLALVAKIINDHGGVIECESKPGKTCFRVLMPMYR
ncbi:two-component system sensor histidine kinase NtrB [Methylocystis bryophila]|uniref:histidine kinase n=1 Tax=Methylocystis bryophila TaxID=655015 RepID=A0A1W6MQ65_9HYPH|nr:ATP-binding protein [Methylocystis bryophila]ARN79734.1 two-component sensor histidine kinase [Methylocystis bryophila]BDV39608.1 PAS domain-containing sensor histidine kinase [Methylocystis bryophila]